jgi:hypothetical protein
VRLDSVYFDTEQHDLVARGVTLRCRTGRTDAGWQLKTDNGCSTSRSGRGDGFTSSSESSPYLPAPRWCQERSGARTVAVAGRGVERAGRRPGQGERAALARGLREGAAGPARSRGGCREDDRRGLGYQVGHGARGCRPADLRGVVPASSRADPGHRGQNPVGSVSSSGSAGRSSWWSGRNAAVCSSQIRASYRPPILVRT